jgi:hypothetical protein
MAQPNIASVSISSNTFRAVGVHFGVSTLNNGSPGMPLMGSISCSVLVMVDLNDQVNMPFATLQSIFTLSYGVTREKIQDIVLTFWSDDSAENVICSYSFRGWISNYVTTTGMGRASSRENDATNHVLTLTLQPELDVNNFVKIQLGN